MDLVEETENLSTAHIPELVFRDYDIRGLADSEINPQFAKGLGRALGTLICDRPSKPSVYVGRDARLSSMRLASALKEGLVACGCNVIDLGEITTPALNFAVHHGNQSGNGIMVTASHNPATYNGFKIILQHQVISGETLQRLIPMMRNETPRREQAAGSVVESDIVSQYLDHIVEISRLDKSFKLVIDGANSVPGPIATQLFDRLGCLAFPLYCDIDGSFPNHQPNPADEKNLVDLQRLVIDQQAELGLAFDGDGDRVVVISGRGRIVWPDQLMMIFARDVLANQPGADIVFDVKSSSRLADIIRHHGGNPIMCKTGHAHVRKQVHDNNSPLGGEFSGHIFFNDRWRGFDDGLYAAVRLLEILCARQQTLDQVIDELETSVSTAEILLPASEDEKFELMKTLSAGCQFPQAHIICLDGLRVEYPTAWGLIRASNTSANLTLRFEADDEHAMAEVKAVFRKQLSPFINNIKEYI
ncbi:Phosphomannomutase/phosphoglucomutase [Gammaproteobacteria bacterium MOLA455]|nr:Phosphomannomutase/phosphoglucomutase [Gammaproteobacteria bacterium MOLA455]